MYVLLQYIYNINIFYVLASWILIAFNFKTRTKIFLDFLPVKLLKLSKMNG